MTCPGCNYSFYYTEVVAEEGKPGIYWHPSCLKRELAIRKLMVE